MPRFLAALSGPGISSAARSSADCTINMAGCDYGKHNTNAPDTIQPGIFVGKGFGDLPASLSWLRPFAITGAVVDEIPLGTVGRAFAPNLASGGFDSVVSPAVETLHW